MSDKPLAQVLLEANYVTPAQLDVAYREQRTTQEKLEDVLERLGFVSARDVLEIIGRTYDIQAVDLARTPLDPQAAKLVPESLARQHRLLPVQEHNGTLTVAMADIHDIFAIDKLRQLTGLRVEPRIADEVDVVELIDEVFGLSAYSDQAIEECVRQVQRIDEEDQESPPLVKLVNLLLTKGVKERATDVHLEADQDVGRVRYRIDGVLHLCCALPKKVYMAAVSRVKVMGGMDITNNRIPHDGAIAFPIGARQVDMRVSTMPGAYGESAVLRVLEKPRYILSLDQMGFAGENLQRFKRLVDKPYGMVVVTGPTGAGKSTTLYGALRMLNALEKSIVTVEDPIEYRIPLVKQTQVNQKAGYTFANALRAILRHDPDIILIGEMRDKETAEIAMRAAMTGHLLFTTLHANTAAAAIPRLIDMGIEPFIVASSVLAVIGQRLVRRICNRCREPYLPHRQEFPPWYAGQLDGVTLIHGKGCSECRQTGYRGRIGVYELLEVTPEVSAGVAKRGTPGEIEALCDMRGMRDDALDKVRDGVTTLAELQRVLG
jgi:type IV pilus assembly protein PilB